MVDPLKTEFRTRNACPYVESESAGRAGLAQGLDGGSIIDHTHLIANMLREAEIKWIMGRRYVNQRV